MWTSMDSHYTIGWKPFRSKVKRNNSAGKRYESADVRGE